MRTEGRTIKDREARSRGYSVGYRSVTKFKNNSFVHVIFNVPVFIVACLRVVKVKETRFYRVLIPRHT